MSLRAFHLFFIAISAIMAAFCSAWAFSAYRADHQLTYAAGSVLAAASVAALAMYGAAFQRKTRNL